MTDLPHQLDRTLLIKAKPETVFRYFTDNARWAKWWGAESAIDATAGGKVSIRYPNGAEAVGEVLEVVPPERIVFTYGYASGTPIPPGASRVTIDLERTGEGTRLTLRHEFVDAAVRDQHVQGWRYQLSLFANIVSNEAFADASKAVDAWFRVWAVTDEPARAELLNRIAAPGIRFHDRHSSLDGMHDLLAHICAALRYTPGVWLQRRGDVRQCQGAVLADWVAIDGDAKERMSGTSVFVLDAERKIESVTSFARSSRSPARPGYGCNSAVSFAPPISAITAANRTALRESLATQMVSLPEPPSAGASSTLYVSKVPAGTVTLSDPVTFRDMSFTFCFCRSKLRKVVV